MKRTIGWLLTLVLLLSACALPSDSGGEESGYLLYFLAETDEARGGDLIRSSYEEMSLPENASLEEQVAAVVERLITGSEDDTLRSPLPSGVTLQSITIQDNWVIVDFSSTFARLGGVELSLADYCLTLSLTALEGISAVAVTAQGREVGQQPKQIFYERDVLLSDMGDVLQTVEVTLYFLNGDGALEGERRTLEIYEGQTLAENLIAALLAGPENRELTAVIPESFIINSVRVDDGICYVNISAESLAELPEDEAAQRLILWSLSDSLYSTETIRELRFLSNGEEMAYFGLIPVETVAVRPQG